MHDGQDDNSDNGGNNGSDDLGNNSHSNADDDYIYCITITYMPTNRQTFTISVLLSSPVYH